MARITTRTLSTPVQLRTQLISDVKRGFSQSPKELPPKYFYDVLGSGIFEAITELPEYYVTRAESLALKMAADEIGAVTGANRLVELGSGSSKKTGPLLETMHRRSNQQVTYAALDISPSALQEAASELVEWAPWLHVDCTVVDFLLPEIEQALSFPEPQLGLMLGSTLGNLHAEEQVGLLRSIAGSLKPGDRFLFGIDLVKDPSVIEPAYNDAAGVTEEFNKNVIRVLQRELGATCQPDDFRHYAPYVIESERIEMRLYATRDVRCEFGAQHSLPSYNLYEGEYILTEISQKFRREGVEALAAEAKLRLEGWWTDPDAYVALALLGPA